jgi:hypothetical protein
MGSAVCIYGDTRFFVELGPLGKLDIRNYISVRPSVELNI